MVSVSQNLKFSIGRVFEFPDFEFELDFDRQTPHSKSGQNPDSDVRRRLEIGRNDRKMVVHFNQTISVGQRPPTFDRRFTSISGYPLIPSVLKMYGKDMAIMVKNRAIDIFRV